MVQGLLGRRVRKRRLSAGTGCFGWGGGLRRCGHEARRETGRRGQGGRGYPPRMTALTKVPETDLWTLLPEATRNEVLGLLGMLLERQAVAARPTVGETGGEHGASA